MKRMLRQIFRSNALRKACAVSLIMHAGALGVMAAWSLTSPRHMARMGSDHGVVVLKARWAEVEPTPVLTTIRLPREAMVIEPHRAMLERRFYDDIPGDQVPLKELLTAEALENSQPTAQPKEVDLELARADVDQPVQAATKVPPVHRVRSRRTPQPKLAARPVTSTPGVRTGPNFAGNRPPHYPAIAQQNGWHGVVMLRIVVAVDGRVSQVQVEESSGYPVLDAAAAQAVSQWRGNPATLDGEPVETEELQPVRFQPRTRR